MNTKQIVAIVAVLALAAAGIGAAYAYSATLDNTGNTVPAKYLTLAVDKASPGEKDFIGTFSMDDLDFDTVTEWVTTDQKVQYTYSPAGQYQMPEFDDLQQDASKVRYAVQVGKTLEMVLNSALLGDGEYYTLSCDVSRALTQLEEGVYYLSYTVNGVTNTILMNGTHYDLLISDVPEGNLDGTGGTQIDVRLLAVKTTVDALLAQSDLSFEDVKLTFQAVVDESTMAQYDADDERTPLVPQDSNAITVSSGAELAQVMFVQGSSMYFMKPTTPYSEGSAVYKLPNGEYVVKVLGSDGTWLSDTADNKVDTASVAATISFYDADFSALKVITAPMALEATFDPNTGLLTKLEGKAADMTEFLGILLQAEFSFDVENEEVKKFVYLNADDYEVDSESKLWAYAQGDKGEGEEYSGTFAAEKTYYNMKLKIGTVETATFTIITAEEE